MAKRIGIIGAGNISETHARAAAELEGVTIAAVYGENRERAKRLANRYGCTAPDSLNSFLEAQMDIVAIGSPSGLHAEHGMASARKGIHVLVEKPIDVTTQKADALIAACDDAGVKLGVFFQDRTAADICKAKELIEGGVLGKPILISASVKWYRPPEYYKTSRWRGTRDLDGGGALINQGIHTVDLLLWLMGDVSRVYARAATALHEIDVEDTLVCTLEFDTGAIGTLEAATSVYPGYPRRLEITGSEGTLVIEHDVLVAADLRSPLHSPPSSQQPNRNPSANSPVVSDVRGHRRILEDFIQAINNDSTPLCNGREARRSVALVEAIYESARSGRPVALVNR